MNKITDILKGLGKTTKVIIAGIMSVVLILILVLVITSPSGKTTFSAETSLKEVFEISDLSTAEYTYNSIVEIKNNWETMYHVAYKGTVKVGVDFSEIEIIESADEVRIVIPNVEIQSVVVDTILDYIFTQEKYNTENGYAQAYNACIDDLTEKAQTNQTLLATAKESAVDTITALLRPFESQLAEGQIFNIVFADEQQEEGAK